MHQSNALLRRIFGKETEVGLPVGKDELPEAAPKTSNDYWGSLAFSSGTALSDGGRLYLDGKHWEIATPEEDSIKNIVRRIRAQDLVFSELVIPNLLEDQQDLFPNKRNVDELSGKSFGSHENFQMRRSAWSDLTKILPIFILKTILCGSGGLKPNASDLGDGFVISPRALFLETVWDIDTMNARPIINSRDEPHADASQYARLHVISGDANLNQHATFLSFGIMHIALSLLEDGEFDQDKPLGKLFAYDSSYAVNDFRSVAYSISGWRLNGMLKPEMRDGVYALKTFLLYAKARYRSPTLTEEISETITLSLKLLDNLASFNGERDASGNLKDNYSFVAKYMDWPLKMKLFELYDRDLKANQELDRMTALRSQDLTMHHMSPAQSLFNYLEFVEGHKGYYGVESIWTEQQIIDYKYLPNPRTRSALRGFVVQAAEEFNFRPEINWAEINIQELNLEFEISDPASSYTAFSKILRNKL